MEKETKTRAAKDVLTMEVEQEFLKTGIPWFQLSPGEYNAVLSIMCVTHKKFEDVVDELLQFAISRTRIVSSEKMILDFSKINLE